MLVFWGSKYLAGKNIPFDECRNIKCTWSITIFMWFSKITVLPSYQAVVYKHNAFLKTIQSGVSQFFTGFGGRESLFAVLLPIYTQLYSVNDLMVVTRQNFSFSVSFSIEYRVVDARKFSQHFSIVQMNENGFRIPLADFEAKLEMHAKTLFSKAARSVSIPRFASDTDYKFSQISQELSDIFDLSGVTIEGVTVTEIRMTNEGHHLMLTQLSREQDASAPAPASTTTVPALTGATTPTKPKKSIKKKEK
jgi:hypothetical protein